MSVTRVIEVSEETLSSMEALAEITGAKSGIGELIQDALRTYEWILHEQASDRSVVSVPLPMLKELSQRPELTDVLPKLFDNLEEAKRYFAKAA
jgi:hypothetical protein